MKPFDCIVRGGLVTHHDYEAIEDIGIRDGRICALGDLHGAPAAQVIDAAGQRIVPGGIDPHTHLDAPYGGLRGGDSILSGTRAAAYGGTTCIVDFAAGGGSLTQRVAQRRAYFERQNPAVDFALHCMYDSGGAEHARQVRTLRDAGVSSVKYFMNNANARSDGVLQELMEACAQEGITVCLHAENESLAGYYTRRLQAQGNVQWRFFAQARPPVCELEAVQRACVMAEAAGARVYFMHLTTAGAAAYLAQRRSMGQAVYGETCLHYLCLTDDVYARDDGDLFSVVPPLRKQNDQTALWRALQRGELQCCSSDHVSYTVEEKRRNLGKNADGSLQQDFTKLPGGLPGIELRLPTLIGGVQKGLLSWQELVRINSYHPAKVFGLRHRKGEIACGLDADLVILQAGRCLTVRGAKDLHMQCDYTPYSGLRYDNLPQLVMLRGKTVMENGRWTGAAEGQFVPRQCAGAG